MITAKKMDGGQKNYGVMIRIRILTDAIIRYLLMKKISIRHIIKKMQNFFTER